MRSLVESKAKDLRNAQSMKQRLVDQQQAEIYQNLQKILQLNQQKPQGPM